MRTLIVRLAATLALALSLFVAATPAMAAPAAPTAPVVSIDGGFEWTT